ncbi:MAG: Flp pilus assembly complex ATPase component TadA [Planctomycetes bacterium]|nr:Flp pilus assembly complex ATPase component TadA [Planctomycetota bacterium]
MGRQRHLWTGRGRARRWRRDPLQDQREGQERQRALLGAGAWPAEDEPQRVLQPGCDQAGRRRHADRASVAHRRFRPAGPQRRGQGPQREAGVRRRADLQGHRLRRSGDQAAGQERGPGRGDRVPGCAPRRGAWQGRHPAQPPGGSYQGADVQRIRALSGRPTLDSLLLESGALRPEQVEQANQLARSKSLPLERAILTLRLADEEVVYTALAKASGMPFANPAKAKIAPEVLGKVPKDQIQQNQALPILIKDGRLYVAVDDPLKTYVADHFSFLAGMEVRCALAPPGALKEAIRKALGGGESRAATAAGTAKPGAVEDADAPIIRLVQKTVDEALAGRASDIHVEPFESRIRVRYRIDGVLREKTSLDKALLGPLTSRIKIMAAMDIAEKRKPQDGRIEFRSAEGRAIDIRTSVLPGNHGETIVMRLLDKERNLLSLEDLGFVGEDHDRFQRILKRPNGIFLVTGPTGSGKTTTLYAALRQLNRPDVKIITAEDPVEFDIAGINQCQVKAGIGLSFARILRAMLRQAPNIILVGEIRDRETAEIAVQAALTGHLVFSTLHTNDAPSAITRLVDIGVKPFLVAAAVQAVMAQRLLRVLCPKCKEPYQASTAELRTLGVTEAPGGVRLHRAVGCDACEQSGYRGRKGIFELMEMDTTLRDLTFRQEPTLRLAEAARTAGGMHTLFEDGVRKVLGGTTTAEELLRVTASA